MIVCVCHRVSDRDIRAAAASGCPDFDALQDELRVATACGACRECAQACFATAPGPKAERGAGLGAAPAWGLRPVPA